MSFTNFFFDASNTKLVDAFVHSSTLLGQADPTAASTSAAPVAEGPDSHSISKNIGGYAGLFLIIVVIYVLMSRKKKQTP